MTHHGHGAHRRHGHAIVIGAGIAGLLAARALSETFQQVDILERDRLPSTCKPRPGVPQGRHAHALQARGLQLFEEFFPGLQDELSKAGAPLVDFCAHARLQLPGGAPPPATSGIFIQPVSRPFLEKAVRDRVARIPGVRIRDQIAVMGLLQDPADRRVTGVRLKHRSPQHRPDEYLRADLVIDASGRGSHLPDWLAALGLPRPAETIVDANVAYVTRHFAADPDHPGDWLALFETPRAPDFPRGCFALRTEGNQLIVTLQGAAGDHPPKDEQGFQTFLESLAHATVNTIAQMVPLSAPYRYAHTANRRRHLKSVRPWPDGLIALGDAACVFNPVYAQGMTVAALQTLALRDLLECHELHGIASAFQRRSAHITRWPWLMATLSDLGWTADASTSLLLRAAQWYLGRWYALIPHHPDMFQDFARVVNMLCGPGVLARPRHLWRIIGPGPMTKSLGAVRPIM
ncbi:NAD(P)/FAD-dependent oxidoreductase [Streptomyces sp. NPDC087901]|uniref:NAD(P)/FAD-dependent oxidoreductase n=1 Tax=Streptomyces sp. NPDC087901 TaxID=3365818 RepID=UPI0038009E8D